MIYPKYGSAYRIGGRLVLTAAHLLNEDGSRCRVRSKQSFGETVAKVVWKASQEDVALIELPESIEPYEAVVFGRLPEPTVGEKLEFQMYGYPRWGRTQREQGVASGGRQVEGIIYLSDTSPDGLLVLETLRSPESSLDSGSDWEGNSGAAITCDGLVIAVQRQHQNPKRAASLEASPLMSIYCDEQWCRLLRQHGIDSKPETVCLKLHDAHKVPFVLPQLDISTFTGRNEELRKLEELLLTSQSTKVCSIAGLAGEGGIGKSALAYHFATIHKDDFPDGVIGLRVDGKDVNTIAREFARCCGGEIDLDDKRDAAAIMQEVFAPRRMLLIFDNAEDASIRSLRPGGKTCAVIITTRNRALSNSLDISEQGKINLSPLSDPDSLRLLEKLIGKERVAAEPEAVSDLIQLAGHLPLALQIIGSALTSNKGRSLTDYAASLMEERRRLTRLRIRGDDHFDLRACFSLSLKQLQSEEVNFFACLSVCAGDGFSRQTALAASDCGDEYTAQDYLEYLCQLSLLNYSRVDSYATASQDKLEKPVPYRENLGFQVEAGEGTPIADFSARGETEENRFVFHPLIRLFAQDLAVERNLWDEAQANHAYYFINLVKSHQARRASNERLMTQNLKDIVLAGEWLQNQKIADYQFVIGLLPFFQKYGYWQQAVDFMSGFQLLSQRKEDWNAAVLLCIQHAKYLSLLGQWIRAEEVLKEIVDIPDKIQVQDTGLRCRVMWLEALGKVLQQQGRLDEAVAVLQRCVLISEQLNDSRYLGISLNVLRNVLQQQSRLDDAVINLQCSVKSAEQISSKNSLLVCLSILAGVLKEQECFIEAAKLFQRSAEIAEQLDNTKELLNCLNSLGDILWLQGYLDEAVEVCKRSVEIAEKLGDVKELIVRWQILGKVLNTQERFDEAVDAISQSIKLIECLDDKKQLLKELTDLIKLLKRQKKSDEILRVCKLQVEIAEQLGVDKLLVLRLNALGRALQYKGNFNEAIATFQRSIDLANSCSNNKLLISSLSGLGTVLQKQGNLAEAVDVFQHCVDLVIQFNLKKILPTNLINLGEALSQYGKLDMALEKIQYFAEAFEDPVDKKSLVDFLINWGRNLHYQNRNEEAVFILKRASEIVQNLNDQHSLAEVLNSLGLLLRQQQKWVEAEEVYQRSKDICENLDEADTLLKVILHNLGLVLDKQNKWDEAEKMLRYSYDLSVKLEDQQGQAKILNSLGKLLQKQGEDKLQLALMYCRASIKLGEQVNDRGHLAKAHTTMGYTLLKCGKIDEAIEELCQGFEIDESLMNSFGIIKITRQLTDALLGAGKPELALAYCQRALAIAPNSQDLKDLYNELSSSEHNLSQNTLIRGTIKFIRHNTHNNTKWGYIISSDDGLDIYFREGFIDSECISQLKKGTLVEVDVKQTPKGLCAKGIKIIRFSNEE
ncbi:tetratricopeptide repeat protein [Alkalinema pantanalense CENA528]|uniref:tetratricopeptide repeat protein n=1 Tax=Alkalinema pantanalense TaxID=1620705 RepID=UPI003D6EB28B